MQAKVPRNDRFGQGTRTIDVAPGGFPVGLLDAVVHLAAQHGIAPWCFDTELDATPVKFRDDKLYFVTYCDALAFAAGNDEHGWCDTMHV